MKNDTFGNIIQLKQQIKQILEQKEELLVLKNKIEKSINGLDITLKQLLSVEVDLKKMSKPLTVSQEPTLLPVQRVNKEKPQAKGQEKVTWKDLIIYILKNKGPMVPKDLVSEISSKYRNDISKQEVSKVVGVMLSSMLKKGQLNKIEEEGRSKYINN